MKRFHLSALIGSLSTLACVVVVIYAMQVREPRPVSRLESEAPSDAPGVNVQTCAECHSDIVSDFATAPHANTLRPGHDPAMISLFAGQSVEIEGRRFSFSEEQNELWFQSEDLDYRRRVDWVFGSGRHALTPISLDPIGMTQLYVSSFADGQLRSTPGTPAVHSTPLRLGNHESEADTRRCFGCHV
ncbi:MAG: hypothetical protein ACF788_04125, partial [Novipirellula sp. JB048]